MNRSIVLKPLFAALFLSLTACGGSSTSPQPVTLTITTADIDVFERDAAAAITISASSALTESTEVRLLATGSATAGEDYDDTLTVIFPAGSNEINFQLPIIDDSESEGPETVIVSLYNTDKEHVTVNDSQSVKVTILPYIKQLANSPYNTCILAEDGEVKCWGGSYQYNAGTGTVGEISDSPDEMGGNLEAAITGDTPITAIASGQYITCGLGNDSLLRCWGKKIFIGLNKPSDYATDYIGDDLAELGNALPTVDLGTGRTVTQFSMIYHHACALLDNGRIKCWGRNDDGRLGVGDTEIRGDADNQMGDNLPYVDLGTDSDSNPWTAKAVAADYGSSCAILSNDQVKCWGSNSRGQLGTGDTHNRGNGVSADNDMGNNIPFVDLGAGRSAKAIHPAYNRTCAILDDDSLKCWGAADNYGPFGDGLKGNQLTPVAIDTGGIGVAALGMSEYSSCVLLLDNSLKCLGDNTSGQLGHDQSYTSYGHNTGETLFTAPDTNLGTDRYAVALPDGGYEFSCALLNSNEVKCWGISDSGALGNVDLYDIYIGDGEDASFSNPVTEMGDNLPAVQWY